MNWRRKRQLLTVLMAGGWSPRKIAGLALWLQADDIAGSDGDAVATWTSREGNTYAFTQSDNAKKPALKTGANGINGHNTVRGNGTSSLLRSASNISSAAQGTFFVVYRLAAPLQNYQTIFGSMDEASAANYYMCFVGFGHTSTAKTGKIGQRNGDVGDDVKGSTVLAAGTPYLYTARSDGAAYSMRINGAAQTLAVVTGGNNGDWFGDTANRDSFTLFGIKYNAEAQWLKGDIAEVLLYDAALTDSDILTVEAYLANRYGLDTAAFLAFGDSKTAPEGYQPALKTNLNAADTTNRWGYSTLARYGYSAALWHTQIDADLAALSMTVLPSWVLVNVGANDVGPTQPALDADTWKADFAYVLDAIHTKYPLAQVRVMRIWRRYNNGDLTALNDTWIPAVLTSRSTWAAVGPDERVFLENGDNGATYTVDGLHPNAAGYALTAAQWQTIMGY